MRNERMSTKEFDGMRCGVYGIRRSVKAPNFIALRAFYYDQIIYFMSRTIVQLKKT